MASKNVRVRKTRLNQFPDSDEPDTIVVNDMINYPDEPNYSQNPPLQSSSTPDHIQMSIRQDERRMFYRRRYDSQALGIIDHARMKDSKPSDVASNAASTSSGRSTATDGSGKRRDSHAMYERFLDMWKKENPNDPKKKDVKIIRVPRKKQAQPTPVNPQPKPKPKANTTPKKPIAKTPEVKHKKHKAKKSIKPEEESVTATDSTDPEVTGDESVSESYPPSEQEPHYPTPEPAPHYPPPEQEPYSPPPKSGQYFSPIETEPICPAPESEAYYLPSEENARKKVSPKSRTSAKPVETETSTRVSLVEPEKPYPDEPSLSPPRTTDSRDDNVVSPKSSIPGKPAETQTSTRVFIVEPSKQSPDKPSSSPPRTIDSRDDKVVSTKWRKSRRSVVTQTPLSCASSKDSVMSPKTHLPSETTALSPSSKHQPDGSKGRSPQVTSPPPILKTSSSTPKNASVNFEILKQASNTFPQTTVEVANAAVMTPNRTVVPAYIVPLSPKARSFATESNLVTDFTQTSRHVSPSQSMFNTWLKDTSTSPIALSAFLIVASAAPSPVHSLSDLEHRLTLKALKGGADDESVKEEQMEENKTEDEPVIEEPTDQGLSEEGCCQNIQTEEVSVIEEPTEEENTQDEPVEEEQFQEEHVEEKPKPEESPTQGTVERKPSGESDIVKTQSSPIDSEHPNKPVSPKEKEANSSVQKTSAVSGANVLDGKDAAHEKRSSQQQSSIPNAKIEKKQNEASFASGQKSPKPDGAADPKPELLPSENGIVKSESSQTKKGLSSSSGPPTHRDSVSQASKASGKENSRPSHASAHSSASDPSATKPASLPPPESVEHKADVLPAKASSLESSQPNKKTSSNPSPSKPPDASVKSEHQASSVEPVKLEAEISPALQQASSSESNHPLKQESYHSKAQTPSEASSTRKSLEYVKEKLRAPIHHTKQTPQASGTPVQTQTSQTSNTSSKSAKSASPPPVQEKTPLTSHKAPGPSKESEASENAAPEASTTNSNQPPQTSIASSPTKQTPSASSTSSPSHVTAQPIKPTSPSPKKKTSSTSFTNMQQSTRGQCTPTSNATPAPITPPCSPKQKTKRSRPQTQPFSTESPPPIRPNYSSTQGSPTKTRSFNQEIPPECGAYKDLSPVLSDYDNICNEVVYSPTDTRAAPTSRTDQPSRTALSRSSTPRRHRSRRRAASDSEDIMAWLSVLFSSLLKAYLVILFLFTFCYFAKFAGPQFLT